MAGKGGGSWKVAYADFVTAMMAFFLVMWIGAQDSKIKQAVANYFIDPSGAAKTPSKTGSTFDSLTYGPVNSETAVDGGKGRDTFIIKPGEPSTPTARVHNNIARDPALLKYWREQAARQRDAAATAREVVEGQNTQLQIATRELAKQMRDEAALRATKLKDATQVDLLFGAIGEVNWAQLAEDLLQK